MRDFETRAVKEELIAMELDDVDMMDADDTPTDSSRQANPSNMQQIVPTADDGDGNWDSKIDPGYMKLLDSCREDGDSYLGDNPLRCFRYEVDNGSYDQRGFKPITNMQRRSREDRNTTRVNKKSVESKPPRVQPSSKKKTSREAAIGLRRRQSLATEKRAEGNKKENSDGEMVLNENYKLYLKWLVENSKSSSTNPQKEIQVKREEDTMSLSDDTGDIIAVGNSPFMDEEDSPFVASKCYKVVDLEDENDNVGDQSSSLFRKEIMDVLKRPYNEEEFSNLDHEASVRRPLMKFVQLRNGREFDCQTDYPTPSYLDQYPDLKRMFSDSIREKDHHRALNLLRGFIFYLEKMARVDAFKPWLDPECVKITFSGHKSNSLQVQ